MQNVQDTTPRDGENCQYDKGGGTKSSDPPPVPSKLPNVHGIQKGKTRVLSSGRVVGDPEQWNVVKDLRPREYELPITVKVKNLQATSEHENSSSTKTNKDQNNNEFEIIDRDKGQNIVSNNIKLYRHEVQKKSIETKVINTVKEQESESSNINVDRNKGKLCFRDELAIVEVPNVVQIDESYMIQIESSNRILHDIMSYNFDEIKSLQSEENQIAKEEKICVLPVQDADHEDFANCISSCDLNEIKFKGSPFTWWNVEHLARTWSDHAPMLLTCEEGAIGYKKPFRFLKFWIENASFIDVVRQNWLFEEHPSAENRQVLQRAQAEFKRYLDFEEIFWATKGRFLQERDTSDFFLLGNIPEIINEADNIILCRQPTFEEIKKAIFNLNGDSASGPDGLSEEYEVQSGQKVNKEKSAFYLHQSAWAAEKELVEECMGMSEGHFPLKYLGCPITHSRKRKEHYADHIKKVKAKLQSWKGNKLSYGGKVVLITSVLQSVPIHVKVNTRLHGRKHVYLNRKGGLGFRSMFNVSKAMYTKLWWRFKIENLPYGLILCGTNIARSTFQLWFSGKGWTSSVWYDNWTQLGPLYTYQTEVMHDHLPDRIVEHIKHHMDHTRSINMGDKPGWIKTSTGKFSVKSAWEILRKKVEENANFKKIWVQDLPLKISFFSWRV
ncbi:hypothetical protein H5410_057457 [Solanum commersonii]|uniref:Reverse transcriptase zinc-binding domain-containing protein n=1 Tax=Solanum commersonii TaxID=4109 RepID=A0A9J5WMY8_SOLCO|nr:hypothetical protein H5410_057457 [Solanum commersonii]